MTDQAFAERDQLVDLLAQVRALGAATTGTAGEGPAWTAERLRDCVIGPLARLLDQAPDSDGRPDAAPGGEALGSGWWSLPGRRCACLLPGGDEHPVDAAAQREGLQRVAHGCTSGAPRVSGPPARSRDPLHQTSQLPARFPCPTMLQRWYSHCGVPCESGPRDHSLVLGDGLVVGWRQGAAVAQYHRAHGGGVR